MENKDFEKAKDLYLNHKLKMMDIAKILNCSFSIIQRNFKKNNVPIRTHHKQTLQTRLLQSEIKKKQIEDGIFIPFRRGKKFSYKSIRFSKDEVLKIIDVYKNTDLTSIDLSKKYKCSLHLILNLLKKNNVPLKKFNHRYNSKKQMSLKRKERFKLGNLGVTGCAKLSMEGDFSEGRNNPFYGKHHNNDTLNKLRKFRETFVTPKRDTKIETRIQNYLKELNFEFFTHYYMRITNGFQCDIFLPSLNLIIECDGDFFHCNPKFYSEDFIRFPKGNDKRKAKMVWERDRIRKEQLEAKGYKVLRLWESEINNLDLNKFKEIILKYE